MDESDGLEFVRSMLEQMAQSGGELLAQCERETRLFLPNCRGAAPVIVRQVEKLLQTRTSASLLRIGDGEGNALALTQPNVRKVDLDGFALKFSRTVGISISEEQAFRFCWALRVAIEDADIIGVRSIDPEPRGPELELIARHINRGRQYEALGILGARRFLQHMVSDGRLRSKILTSAWIHLGLVTHIDELLRAAERVMIIAGRVELQRASEERLGHKLVEFIAVPGEGGRPADRPSTHYEIHGGIADRLRTDDLGGTLVLVGAGMLGKIYCHAAKQGGAVALDMGSAFDILAGKATRPVHGYFDLTGVRWV